MEEFYKQQEIPREEIERLKQIEYPNFVSETLFDEVDLKEKKSDFWAKEGQKISPKLFKEAAKRVSAYKDFLQKK